MKPVLQTIDGPQGNCFSACLASLFELPIDDVPNFWISGGAGDAEWWGAVRDWLRPRGFGIMTLKLTDRDHLDLFNGWMIVSGESRPGRYHATIWKDGYLVHDPHPSAPGVRVENVDMLYPLDPSTLVVKSETSAIPKPTQGHVESTPQRSNEELQARIESLERALAGEATMEMIEAGWETLPKKYHYLGYNIFRNYYKAMRDAALKEA